MFKLKQENEEVQYAIDRILALKDATWDESGLMSADDKRRLDNSGLLYDTTEHWNSQLGFIPKRGEIIIYSDYKTITRDGRTVYVPGIKIGSGNGYLVDLPFVDDAVCENLAEHIQDRVAHVTQNEKDFWNNKLNMLDAQIENETLVFNRN